MTAVRIELPSGAPLMDEPISIRVSGLGSGQAVTLRLAAPVRDRGAASYASFTAGVDGTVDLASCAANDGPYSGVDPMGLFWSLRLDSKRPAPGASD